jgi:hypothetical protein
VSSKVSRKKTDKVRIQSFAESLADAGSAAPSVKESLKWKATDLTAMDGTLNSLILAEFSEQYPLHIQQRGMCTMVRVFPLTCFDSPPARTPLAL